MGGPRALLLGELPVSVRPQLEAAGLRCSTAAGWAEAVEPSGFQVLVTASHIVVTEGELTQMPELRVIGRAAAGTDNVDLEAVERRGVHFVHAPEANSQSASELTMTLLFAVARRLAFHHDALTGGHWSRNEELGCELAGRRLGVIGIGRVGSRVVRMAGAIPMAVSAYDPYLEDDRFEALDCRRARSLDELLAASDVLTVHCPLTPGTRRMLEFDQLALLPKGAIVLNVARGGLLDEAALARLIASGHLAGAGIDCWEKEPPPPDNPLLALPAGRLIATPHLGARTVQARERVAIEAVEGVVAACRVAGIL